MLGHHWTRGEGKIVAREPRPMTGGYQQTFDYVVDVQPPDGAPIRATIHEGFRAPDGGFADPAVGDTVGVLYDAKHEKVKFDTDDPRLSLAPGKQAAADAFAAAASAEPGTPAPSGSDPGPVVRTIDLGGSTGNAERLAKLERLRQSGVLDEVSYEAARRGILDER